MHQPAVQSRVAATADSVVTVGEVVCDKVREPPIVRVTGLPAAVLDSLRFGVSATKARNVVAGREEWRREGRLLADSLHSVIGAVRLGPTRHLLIQLRRSLHKGARPKAKCWTAELAAQVPGPARRRLNEWMAENERLIRLEGALETCLREELSQTSRAVLQVCDDVAFRQALWIASPTLDKELSKLLAGDGRKPRQRVLEGLAAYAARAAVKTSPFSSFTTVGVADWAATGSLVEARPLQDAYSVPEINRLFLSQIVHRLSLSPPLRAKMPVRVNPSATVENGQVVFLALQPGEPLASVQHSRSVQYCLEMVRAHPQETLENIERRLLEQQEGRLHQQVLRPFLEELVSIGILELSPPVPDQCEDPLAAILLWISDAIAFGAEAAWLAGLAESIQAMRAHLASGTRRPDPEARLSANRSAFEAGVRIVQAGQLAAPTSFEPRLVLHDNAVHADRVASLSVEAWRPLVEELRVIGRWLTIHDPFLPFRLLLSDYYLEKFGKMATVSFLALHRSIQIEMQQLSRIGRRFKAVLAFARMVGGYPKDRLSELGRLRTRTTERMTDAVGADGVARCTIEALALESARWPHWVRPARSVAWFVQPLQAPEGPALVFNSAMSGFGKGSERWLSLIDRMVSLGGGKSSCRDSQRDYAAPINAELGGAFGSALNLRRASAPFEIGYPGVLSDRPADQLIDVADLVVHFDEQEAVLRVHSLRLGADVRPLHLGMMADWLLPPAACFLRMGFGEMGTVSSSRSFVSPAMTSAEGVLAMPRVEFGRVVVQRARWHVPSRAMPSRRSGERSAVYWMRLFSWLHEHRIPTRCFVRRHDPSSGHDGARGALGGALDPAMKPMFVDFDNWYSVKAWERSIANPGSMLTLEEALPDPGAAYFSTGGQPRVTELLLETTNDEVARDHD